MPSLKQHQDIFSITKQDSGALKFKQHLPLWRMPSRKKLEIVEAIDSAIDQLEINADNASITDTPSSKNRHGVDYILKVYTKNMQPRVKRNRSEHELMMLYMFGKGVQSKGIAEAAAFLQMVADLERIRYRFVDNDFVEDLVV